MKRWQRGAVIVWAVLMAGGSAVTLLLGQGEEPSAAVPRSVRPSPTPSSPCQGANVLCAATFGSAR
ncbi:hypothetical protein ACGFX4_36370 [Kitasatospora sp. NPDC048365]|uniref:hypothetical protein n=1 Tax=Kitasatospora sp. NPDC048365 TaxID=3364050 RepID=UPI00371BBA9D